MWRTPGSTSPSSPRARPGRCRACAAACGGCGGTATPGAAAQPHRAGSQRRLRARRGASPLSAAGLPVGPRPIPAATSDPSNRAHRTPTGHPGQDRCASSFDRRRAGAISRRTSKSAAAAPAQRRRPGPCQVKIHRRRRITAPCPARSSTRTSSANGGRRHDGQRQRTLRSSCRWPTTSDDEHLDELRKEGLIE